MGFQDYITETEAATFTGVSRSTLKRFAEAGYFHVESDADGLRLFSKSELSAVFGLQTAPSESSKVIDVLLNGSEAGAVTPTSIQSKLEPAGSQLQTSLGSDPAQQASSPKGAPNLKPFSKPLPSDSVNSNSVNSNSVNSNSVNSSSVNSSSVTRAVLPLREEEAPPTSSEKLVQEAAAAPVTSASPVEPSPIRLDTVVESTSDRSTAEAAAHAQLQRLQSELVTLATLANTQEKEIARLKAVTSLHEKLLDSREAELADSRAQRSWLQARIEKLEDQTYRNQLLLLSEIQSNSKLLRLQIERKPAWRAALDWLGLNQERQAISGTIAHSGSKGDFDQGQKTYDHQEFESDRGQTAQPAAKAEA